MHRIYFDFCVRRPDFLKAKKWGLSMGKLRKSIAQKISIILQDDYIRSGTVKLSKSAEIKFHLTEDSIKAENDQPKDLEPGKNFLTNTLIKHSHTKQKDSLEGSLDRVLLAAGLEFSKILVPRLPQNSSNVNIECARKSK